MIAINFFYSITLSLLNFLIYKYFIKNNIFKRLHNVFIIVSSIVLVGFLIQINNKIENIIIICLIFNLLTILFISFFKLLFSLIIQLDSIKQQKSKLLNNDGSFSNLFKNICTFFLIFNYVVEIVMIW